MSSDTPNIAKSSGIKKNTPIDPIVEFQRLKIETAEINAKIRAGVPLLADNSSNEMLGLVLNELKYMRMEVKEIRENLKEIGEKQTKLQDDVSEVKLQMQAQQTVLEVKLSELQEGVTKSQECLDRIDPAEQDIRKVIIGKWRNVEDRNEYFCANFESDTFMIKWKDQRYFDTHTLGVKHQRKMAKVENNTIELTTFSKKGYSTWRRVFYFENGTLIEEEEFGFPISFSKKTFKRIRDPE